MASVAIGPLLATVYEAQSALLEPALEEAGLTWSSFQVLSAVAGAVPGTSQSELAQALGLSNASLSETAFSMVKSGLIVQTTAQNDRRVKSLALTPKAKSALQSVARRAQSIERLQNKGLSEKQLAEVHSALEVMAGNLTEQG